MKLSIWSSYYAELKIEDAVQRFIKNGIYCSEISDEHGLELLNRSENVLETAKGFASFLNEHNFEISQGHLLLGIKICSEDDALEKLYRWIDLYEAIGVKNMVLHCDNLIETAFSKQEKIEKNIEKLRILAEYIKDKDVTICLENLRPHMLGEQELIDRSADDLLYMIRCVGSGNFGICLDTGHLNLTDKNQREFILKVGSKLAKLKKEAQTMKSVKTPRYWQSEEFQPLVEVKTIYGNKVRIPSLFKESWDILTNMSESIISEQGRLAGLKTIKELMATENQMTSKKREDFCKVFVEGYQEQS